MSVQGLRCDRRTIQWAGSHSDSRIQRAKSAIRSTFLNRLTISVWMTTSTSPRIFSDQLPVPRHSIFRLQLQHGDARAEKTEAGGGAEVRSTGNYQSERTLRDGFRWNEHSAFDRLPERIEEGREQSAFLYAYGSYGISIPPTFSYQRLALLDRGVVFVIAHIRGGGEMGEVWRDQGRMKQKMNTFTDFIACAEYPDSREIHFTRKTCDCGWERRRPFDGCSAEYSA